MTVTVLFAAQQDNWDAYEGPLRAAFAEKGLEARLVRDATPTEVDYMVYSPGGTVQDFRPYTNLKAVLNLWAGVENIVTNDTLTAPLARMVDQGLTEGMVEWVTGHVLRHHLGMDQHILGQDGIWRSGDVPPLARDRTVGMLGLGELGRACGEALARLNFNVMGWARSQKSIAGIECRAGADGLDAVLSTAEIVVLLLPLTGETEKLMDAARIARLPAGAVIVNPGRGPLIDDEALLAGIDSGHVGHATLDVFREEPLPPEHPFWAHPKVTVTPHIASATRPKSAARVIAENIRRGEAGEPLLHLVDTSAGY